MLARSVLALLVLGIAPRAAGAQSEAPRSPFVTGQLGVAVLDVARYPGSDKRWIVPVPIVDLRVAKRIYLGGSAGGLSGGAGVYLIEAKGFAWSADFSLTADRPEDRTDALAGMGDRGFGAFAGSTVSYRVGILQATASAALGVEDRMGVMGTLGLSAGGRLGGRWYGQLGGLTVFSDCKNMAWDFGITDRQAARRGALLADGAPGLRPGDDRAYEPDCGLREVRATGVLSYMLSPRFTTFAMGTGVRYEGGAAESPLTRERTSWEAGLGLAWRF